jgi:hypothetical protein
VHQPEHLAARPVMTGAAAEVGQLIDHLLDPQPLGERGRQH